MAPPTATAVVFESMVARCSRPLWTFVLRMTGDPPKAEDLYQETLLRAWRALPGYRDDGRFLSWLFRIAHNVVRDDRRRQEARPRLVPSGSLPEAVDPRRTDARLVARDARARVAAGLATMTADQRAVFLLRMHGDLTFKEIASLTEAPLSTVINRMRDALGKIGDLPEADP